MTARRARFVVVVAVLGMAAGGGAGAASARTSVEIVQPADGKVVTKAVVKAQVRVRGRDFHATVAGRDVTKRFGSPSKKGVRTATLRRGRDFGTGTERLTVRVGTPFGSSQKLAGVNFRALRRNDRRIKVLAREPNGHAPVLLRVRSTGRVAGIRLWVNGRRHTGKLPRHGDGRGFTVHVAPHHGLRFGRNRVTAQVEHADGVVSRSTRTVTMSRRWPLADAGRDRNTAVGRAVTLDGSRTRAPHKGAELSHRWRLVSAPKGSEAIAGTKRRLRFTPDQPGRYTLRLTATSRTEASGRAAAAVSATDEAEVAVGPTTDPMGVPIQTIDHDGGIRVGTTTYPRSGDWLHLLVLDSVTLQPTSVGNRTYDVGDVNQFATDFDAVVADSANTDMLVVLTGQGSANGAEKLPQDTFPHENFLALEKAFDVLGVTTDKRGSTYATIGSFNVGNWSVISEPGTATGAAWQNYKVQHAGLPGFPAAPRSLQGDPGQPGSLNGYLQKYIGTAYQFISPEFVSIDTRAPGSTHIQNVITVGEQRYTSNPTGGGRGMGVQMLVLDSSSLQPLGQGQYNWPSIRNPDGSLNVAQVDGLRQVLNGLTEDPPGTPSARFSPPLVILQTFGDTSSSGVATLNDNAFWVNDTLPDWGRSGHYDEGNENPGWFKWCGGSDATADMKGTTCEPFPNSPSGLAALGDGATITAAIGRMAGMPARTAVANTGGTQFQPAAVAMSLVGSPHPYYDDDVTVQVGARGQRLVGTLRRTQQSQWRVAGAAPTDAFDTSGFWETALGPKSQWPLAPGTQPGTAEAHEDIVAYLWPSDAHQVKDVRQQYATYVDQDWDTYYSTLRGMTVDALRRSASDAEKAAFGQLKALMLGNGAPGGQGPGEFGMISQVKAGIANFEQIFTQANVNNAFNVANIGDLVKNQALQDARGYQEQLEKETAELDAEAPVGDALYFAADLVELFPEGEALGGVLGMFASSWDLFSDVAGSNKDTDKGITRPPDYPRQIQTTVDQLGTQLKEQYDELNAVFDQLELLFVSDPGKLAQAAANFNDQNRWNLNPGDEKKNLQRTIAVSAQAALFSAVMPVAYDQWFIAPVFTSTGNEGPKNMQLAGPRDYFCDDGANPFQEYPDKKNPSDDSYKVPDSSLHYVRFEPTFTSSSGPRDATKRNHLLGRGLKSKSYPMRLTVNLEEHATNWLYPDTVGGSDDGPNDGLSPPASLTDKLFAKPRAAGDAQDPSGLLMSKDEFFGLPNWTTPRLMCGLPRDGRS